MLHLQLLQVLPETSNLQAAQLSHMLAYEGSLLQLTISGCLRP